MLDLHPISYEDKNLINYYSKFVTTLSYEYSFNSLYLWKDLCQTNVGTIYDTLVVQKYDEDNGFFFMMPYSDNTESLYKTLDYLKYNYADFKYLLGDIDDNYLNFLKKRYTIEFLENKNSSEYIYLTNDLINLKGKKYHKKRNHYNNFINLYNFSSSPINSEKIITDCLTLLSSWKNKKCICSKELLIEPLGEIFNDSAIIHIEKCNTDYRGIYAFINNEFLKSSFKDTKYVNREEDCGHKGLQKSKESYHPYKILNKYFIKIK